MSVTLLITAAKPPTVALFTWAKPMPETVMVLPTAAVEGVNEVIEGRLLMVIVPLLLVAPVITGLDDTTRTR